MGLPAARSSLLRAALRVAMIAVGTAMVAVARRARRVDILGWELEGGYVS